MGRACALPVWGYCHLQSCLFAMLYQETGAEAVGLQAVGLWAGPEPVLIRGCSRRVRYQALWQSQPGLVQGCGRASRGSELGGGGGGRAVAGRPIPFAYLAACAPNPAVMIYVTGTKANSA